VAPRYGPTPGQTQAWKADAQTDLGCYQSLARRVPQPRDPWEPFRLWLALTLAVYAVRALFAAQWPGAIPGWVLLVMVLVALALASAAVLFPGRVVPWRQGDGGWWNDLRDDWQLWWRRRRGRQS
jgi:hypothetical protein